MVRQGKPGGERGMRQKVPWNFEGLDPDAREAAKEAARRAGMTLGEWLNQTIADRAAKFGVDPRGPARSLAGLAEGPIGETLDQVATRLSRMTRSKPPTATIAPGAGLSAAQSYGDPYAGDIEAIVAAAAAESERRMRDTNARTSHALDSVARWMERADERWNEVSRTTAERQERTNTVFSQAFGLMTKRLDEIERKLSDSQQPALKPVWHAMERIEKQIGRLATNPAQGEHLARLEQSLQGFESRLGEIAERLDSLPARRPLRRADLGDAVSDIRARQMEIDTGAAPAETPRRGAQEDILRGLKTDMAKLASKLDTVRKPMSETQAADYLREEIASLQDAVQTLASRDTVAALEQAVRDLGFRLLEGRLGGDSDGLVEPIARLQDDVRKLIDFLGANGEGDLTREVRHIARGLDQIGTGPVDPETLAQIGADIAALRETATSSQENGQLKQVTEQITELSQHIAAMGERQVDALEFAALKSAIEEIRAGLRLRGGRSKVSAGEEPAIDFATAFGMQIEALSQKVDALTAARESEIGGASAIAARLDDLAAKLDERPSAPGTGDLAARIEALAAKLDERPAETPADPELNGLLRSLVQKMDDAQKPQPEASALDALERQVATLAERLDRPREEPDVMATLERAMGDLSAQIESLRHETLSAGERAAREAVSEALKAMPMGEVPAAALVTPAIDEIKAVQREAEARTHATLEAVHDTLDKVVGRLARLESDMRAPAPATAQPVMAQPAPSAAPHSASFVPERLGGAPAPAPEPRMNTNPAGGPPPGAAIDLSGLAMEAGLGGRPDLSADIPVEADLPLEPGAGRPTAALRAAMAAPSAGGEGADIKASFIAAARRAAQAAAAEAAAAQSAKPSLVEKLVAAKAATGGEGGSGFARLRQAIDARRRPILLGLAAIVLTIGVAQIATGFLQSEESPATIAPRNPQTAPDGATRPQSRLEPSRPSAAAPQAISAPETTASIAPAPDRTVAASQPENALRDAVNREMAAKLAERMPATAPDAAVRAESAAGAPTPPTRPQIAAQASGSTGTAPQPASVPMRSPGPAASATAPDAPAATIADAPRLRIAGIDAVGPLPDNAGTPALRQAALSGDPAAVFDLASRLAEGRGAPRDLKLAAKLFERAAAEGLAPAQYRLGGFYEKGLGVPRDLALARTWYQRAAERGNAKAMHNLAVLLAEGGANAKPDYAAAVRWFSKAADYGVRDSQYNLAILLARGLGTAQDLPKSYHWFAIAAMQGDTDAAKKRDEVGSRMQAADLARAVAGIERYKPLSPDPAANEIALPAALGGEGKGGAKGARV